MKPSENNGMQATQATLEAPGKMGATIAPAGGKVLDPVVGEKDKQKLPRKENLRLATFGVLVALVIAMLVPAFLHKPASVPKTLTSNQKAAKVSNSTESNGGDTASRTPIIEVTRTPEKPVDGNPVNADQIGHTATRPATQGAPGTLGGVASFGKPGEWSPPPYSGAGAQGGESSSTDAAPTDAKGEHDAMDKASLVFVRNNPAGAGSKPQGAASVVDWGIGLPPGTRLRARLESAVNTAVSTPVVAVIEYNYERNGEIIVPAGGKVFGHLEAADRSGYVGVRFDSLMMPDGTSLAVEAAATDLQLRPLRGQVEGKNTGKNILVRSLSGVGEIGAALVGRGSLNQPLSESDLLRERVGNNIGQTSDQQLRSLALTQRIVVSVPAGREIYVVLEKPAKDGVQSRRAERPSQAANQPSVEELRQLLRLQREMNATAVPTSPE